MSIRLSTIMLTVSLVSVSLGWLVDRKLNFVSCDVALKKESDISAALTSAISKHQFYTNTDEYIRRKEQVLLQSVMRLFDNLGNARNVEVTNQTTGNTSFVSQRDALFTTGRVSLNLMGISSVTEFEKRFKESRIVRSLRDTYLSSDGEKLIPEFADFVQSCLDSGT